MNLLFFVLYKFRTFALMFKMATYKKKILRFKRWSRKNYAIFNSLHNEVVICNLSISTADAMLPKNKKSNINMNVIETLEQKVLGGDLIDYDEALLLTEVTDREELYAAADRIRRHFHGDKMDLCSIVNARSGRCSENCKWCAQSSHYKTTADIYDMIEPREAVSQAKTNFSAGVRKFSLVTSGRTISKKHLTEFSKIYDTLRSETTLELCASMGLLDDERMQMLADCGVKNYHCNIETAPSHFPSLCTTHTTDEKIETLKLARSKGMKLCSGGIIGMGESMAQRVEMAIALQDLGVESIPLNLLNPIPGTPLEGTAKLSDEDILTTIAIFRFVNPRALIRFAGGRTLMLHIQDRAMRAGINGALVGDLLTTVGVGMNEDIAHIRSLGFDC